MFIYLFPIFCFGVVITGIVFLGILHAADQLKTESAQKDRAKDEALKVVPVSLHPVAPAANE